MADQETQPKTKSKTRSPNYPGISLQDALGRVRTLFDKEKRSPANVDVILSDWGYKPRSGAGLVTLAAVKKFGLLNEEGSGDRRRARLSDLAIGILYSEEGSEEWQRLVKQAALTPPIHAAVWREFEGSLPSDQNLKRNLIVEKGFTPGGADEFVRVFRQTAAFANLTEADKLTGNDEDKIRSNSRSAAFLEVPEPTPPGFTAGAQKPLMATLGAATRTTAAVAGQSQTVTERLFHLPLGGSLAILQVPFPMTEAEWSQMIAVLTAMKPGIVQADSPRVEANS